MTKTELNTLLRERLSGMQEEDIETSIAYYNEMIDDRIEDGLSETEAVAALGPMEEILSGILADTPLPQLIKKKVALTHKFNAWEVVLLILGSPIWLSVLISLAAIIVSVYIVVWTVVLVFYAITFSFAASALGGIVIAVLLMANGNWMQGIVSIGMGLICAGLAILFFFLSNQVAKYTTILGKKIWLGIKFCFLTKERK